MSINLRVVSIMSGGVIDYPGWRNRLFERLNRISKVGGSIVLVGLSIVLAGKRIGRGVLMDSPGWGNRLIWRINGQPLIGYSIKRAV